MKKLLSVLLLISLLLGLLSTGAVVATYTDALSDTAAYVSKVTPNPQVGSIGGEWAVLGLARGGYSVPASYYSNVISYVKACDGVLHTKKYTEYSRVILALTAMGQDPTNVAGYDLTAALDDFDKTVWQGVNSAIFALIALDSGNYESSLRQSYIDHILSLEISGGGWALTGTVPDSDMTAMALQALAKYQDQHSVKAATNRALTWLSNNQNADGTFSTGGTATCESTAQVIVALCELGISLQDSRFVKNGNSVMDGLLKFYAKGSGFTHVLSGTTGEDAMSTEQAFYALVAASRAQNGKSTLYRMKTAAAFPDVAGHENQTAIEALVGRQIINGMGDGTFGPNNTMTRAQYCTIVVKALGMPPKIGNSFHDVAADAWYAGFVGAASDAGIVNGVGGGRFDPEGTITRQEAAAMVARAAAQLGLDTTAADSNGFLAQFSDGASVSAWAKDAMAYCYASGILSRQADIQPTKAILRCEIAQMIYNMLRIAGKI